MITEFKLNQSKKTGYFVVNNEIKNNNFIIYDWDKLSFGFDYPITKTDKKELIKRVGEVLK